MSSSTSQFSSDNETRVKPPDNDPFRQKVLTYTSWACLISGPILIALPPRKLDKYTFGLLLCTFVGGNQVSREQTGISMIDRIGQRLVRSTSALPPQALDLQKRAREERERGSKDLEIWRNGTGIIDSPRNAINQSTFSPSCGQSSKEDSSFWRKVWMGEEGENWREERFRREREALNSGKGYFDLIQDQIREVWYGNVNKREDNTHEIKELNKEKETLMNKDKSEKKNK